MQIESKITFTYMTEKEAKIALDSLEPDNMDFIDSCVEDNDLIYKLESRSLKTVLATIDDVLFCEMMAGRVINFTDEEIK